MFSSTRLRPINPRRTIFDSDITRGTRVGRIHSGADLGGSPQAGEDPRREICPWFKSRQASDKQGQYVTHLGILKNQIGVLLGKVENQLGDVTTGDGPLSVYGKCRAIEKRPLCGFRTAGVERSPPHPLPFVSTVYPACAIPRDEPPPELRSDVDSEFLVAMLNPARESTGGFPDFVAGVGFDVGGNTPGLGIAQISLGR